MGRVHGEHKQTWALRMKVVILLCFLVLIQVSNVHNKEEEDISQIGEALGREVRNALQENQIKENAMKSKIKKKKAKGQTKLKKRNKKTKKSRRKSKNGNSKSRKKNSIRKKKKGRGKSKKQRRLKKKEKAKKTKGEKPKRNKRKQTSKQTSNCISNELFKTFIKYQNRERQVKRILGWVKKLDKKKEKALTTFKNASTAIILATSNNTQCDGKSVPEKVRVASERLARCNTTASELCNKGNIVGLNESLADECEPMLSAYTTAFKACVNQDTDCSCFNDLPSVPSSCKFQVMNNNTRIQYRDKCTNSEVEGSFTDCRAQERIVAYYGEKCKTCTGMTTKAPAKRFLRDRLQRLVGRS